MAGTAVELYSRPGEGGDLSGLDERLLEIYAKNPRITAEMAAKELGVESMTPARCLQRVREILNAQDALSRTHQKAMLLLDLVKLRDVFWSRIDNGIEVVTKEGDVIGVDVGASTLNGMTRLLREWRSLIESMGKDVDESENFLREGHAKIVDRAFETAFKEFVRRMQLNSQVTDLPLALEVMEECLAMGFRELREPGGPAATYAAGVA